MKLSVKKGDQVIILTGKDKGKKGKIIASHPDSGRVRVENINLASKHKKARSAQETGGIVKIEGSIDASNVMLICPSCGERTRVAHAIGENGKKFRQCKKCSASLDVKAEKKKPAKKEKADKKKSSEAKETAEVKPEKKTTKKTTAKKAEVSEKETANKITEEPAEKEIAADNE